MSEGGWCLGADSNHRHADFQSAALPTELPRPRPPRAGAASIERAIAEVQPGPRQLRRRVVRRLVLVLRAPGSRSARKPALQVDVGAALRAERPVRRLGRLAADRAGRAVIDGALPPSALARRSAGVGTERRSGRPCSSREGRRAGRGGRGHLRRAAAHQPGAAAAPQPPLEARGPAASARVCGRTSRPSGRSRISRDRPRAARQGQLQGPEPADRADRHAGIVGCEGGPRGGQQGRRRRGRGPTRSKTTSPPSALQAQQAAAARQGGQVGLARHALGVGALAFAQVDVDGGQGAGGLDGQRAAARQRVKRSPAPRPRPRRPASRAARPVSICGVAGQAPSARLPGRGAARSAAARPRPGRSAGRPRACRGAARCGSRPRAPGRAPGGRRAEGQNRLGPLPEIQEGGGRGPARRSRTRATRRAPSRPRVVVVAPDEQALRPPVEA